MPFQMRFRMLSTLLLSLIVPAGSASANMRFNFENCYKKKLAATMRLYVCTKSRPSSKTCQDTTIQTLSGSIL